MFITQKCWFYHISDLNSFLFPQNFIENMNKPYKSPLTPEEDARRELLSARLANIRVAEEQTVRELRALIYKVEANRR